MRITESRLRSIIREVITESGLYESESWSPAEKRANKWAEKLRQRDLDWVEKYELGKNFVLFIDKFNGLEELEKYKFLYNRMILSGHMDDLSLIAAYCYARFGMQSRREDAREFRDALYKFEAMIHSLFGTYDLGEKKHIFYKKYNEYRKKITQGTLSSYVERLEEIVEFMSGGF
jgi:hypothetical protein